MLAASALASSTKANYGKAWGQFLNFCDKMGNDPMEVSGQELAIWLVYNTSKLLLSSLFCVLIYEYFLNTYSISHIYKSD